MDFRFNHHTSLVSSGKMAEELQALFGQLILALWSLESYHPGAAGLEEVIDVGEQLVQSYNKLDREGMSFLGLDVSTSNAGVGALAEDTSDSAGMISQSSQAFRQLISGQIKIDSRGNSQRQHQKIAVTIEMSG